MGYVWDIPHHLLWDAKGTLPMGHEWDIINGTRMGRRNDLYEAFSS